MIVRDPHVVPPKRAVLPYYVAYCAATAIVVGLTVDGVVSGVDGAWLALAVSGVMGSVAVVWGGLVASRWRSPTALLVLPRSLPWSFRTWEGVTLCSLLVGVACLWFDAFFSSVGCLLCGGLLLSLLVWYDTAA